MMKNPNAKVKDFSVSQYPRSGENSETDRLGFTDSKVMGYSIRTNQYRLTIWMKDFFKSTQPFNKSLIVGTELYDYKNDPNETVNVYHKKKYSAISKKMYSEMIAFFKSQQKNKI